MTTYLLALFALIAAALLALLWPTPLPALAVAFAMAAQSPRATVTPPAIIEGEAYTTTRRLGRSDAALLASLLGI